MVYDVSSLSYSILAGSVFVLVIVSAVARLYQNRRILFALSSAALIAVVISSCVLLLSGTNNVFLNTFRVYSFS